MKKRLVMGVILMAGLFLLNSCAPMRILGEMSSRFFSVALEDKGSKKLEELLTAVEAGDKEAISALFFKDSERTAGFI